MTFKNGEKIEPRLDKRLFFYVSEDAPTKSRIYYSKEHQIFILSFKDCEYGFETITQLKKDRNKLAAMQQIKQ